MATASMPLHPNKETSVLSPLHFAQHIKTKDIQIPHTPVAHTRLSLGISSRHHTPVLYLLETVKIGGPITVSITTLRQEISMQDLIISMPHRQDIRETIVVTSSIHDKVMYGLKTWQARWLCSKVCARTFWPTQR